MFFQNPVVSYVFAFAWANEDGFVYLSVKTCVWIPLLWARPVLKSSLAALPRTRRMLRCRVRVRRRNKGNRRRGLCFERSVNFQNIRDMSFV